MAATGLTGTAAAAQGKPGWASFSVGSANFEMPIPAGYCLPTGKGSDAARLLATADKLNVTSLTLLSCTGNPFGTYIIIKTPVPVVNSDFTREEMLKSLGSAFEAPSIKEKIATGALLNESADGLSTAFGQKVDLSGDMRPRGKDDACAYLGGTLELKSTQIAYRASMGSCLTAVGRRFIAVHVYGPDKGPAGVAALIATSRRVMETIRPVSTH